MSSFVTPPTTPPLSQTNDDETATLPTDSEQLHIGTIPNSQPQPQCFSSDKTISFVSCLSTAAAPAQPTHTPLSFGHPLKLPKQRRPRGGIMKYRTRVHRGLATPIAGYVIRDARQALTAASWAVHARQRTAFSVFDGKYLQHCIRDREAVYTDDVSDSESDTESDGEGEEVKKIENAVRALAVAVNLKSDVLKNVAKQVARLSAALRHGPTLDDPLLLSLSLAAHENENDRHQHQGMTEGTRRTALYRAYATKWAWRLQNCSQQSPSQSQQQVQSNDIIQTRFNDPERLSHIHKRHRRRKLFQSLNSEQQSQNISDMLEDARDEQERLLFEVMHVPDEGTSRRLIAQYGSARYAVRSCSRRDVHGELSDEDENEIFIKRVLRDTFGNNVMKSARCAPFKEFVTLGKGKGVLELDCDERMRAFELVVKSCSAGIVDKGESERLNAIWRLLMLVCRFVPGKEGVDNDCMSIVADLVDDDGMKGRTVLKRLATENAKQICRRCVSINEDEAILLKRFSQRFVVASSPISHEGEQNAHPSLLHYVS